MERSFTSVGIAFILIGIAIIIIPIIIKLIPSVNLESIPWFLLYVYRRDGFIFATSPILIVMGVAYIIWIFLRR